MSRPRIVPVFVGGRDGCHTYRIPALAVACDGTVLAFCEGRRTSASDSGDIAILLKRSRDGGMTWSAQAVVHEERTPGEEVTIGNPCPIVDRRDGAVHLVFTRNNRRLFHVRSIDHGLSWSAPEEHSAVLGAFAYPVVRVGAGPGHGTQLADGALVAPVWLCDGEVKGNPARTYRAGVIRSEDGGRRWQAGGLVPPALPDMNECMALSRSDGSLALTVRAGGGCRVWSESRDGGRTWSVPARDPALPCPTC